MRITAVGFTKVDPGASIPVRKTEGAAGFDLVALQDRTVVGGEGSVLVPTGIAIEIPDGYYARIAIRSGLALKEHLAVNAGVIDADYYPNPVGVIVFGTKLDHSYTIKAGERFAQVIVERILTTTASQAFHDPGVYGGSQRTGGFGSTGQ